MQDARECCRELARLGGVAEQAVLPFSTGVIGEPLPVARVTGGMPAALAALDADAWEAAAEGIMTTDTRPKGASRRVRIGAAEVTVSGIAKGAGMIRPDMATMLSFIATDAALPQPLLQRALVQAVNASFNRITVDGDTSTNDSCVLVATGAASVNIAAADADYAAFAAALSELCIELAQAIVRDGEGATKFITIEVAEGRDAQECLDVAYTIAHSPLVKTALFASDPNWGRILAAVGRAGVSDLLLEKVRVYLGDVCIVSNGGRDPAYTEAAGQAVMNREEILIRVLLGRGTACERIWTTDFSYDYVKINAEYRT
jgi:glutamate N-acetyltransferase/amino-acid N-acetyltransferase